MNDTSCASNRMYSITIMMKNIIHNSYFVSCGAMPGLCRFLRVVTDIYTVWQEPTIMATLSDLHDQRVTLH